MDTMTNNMNEKAVEAVLDTTKGSTFSWKSAGMGALATAGLVLLANAVKAIITETRQNEVECEKEDSAIDVFCVDCPDVDEDDEE